jgi:hypothetical protein
MVPSLYVSDEVAPKSRFCHRMAPVSASSAYNAPVELT